MIEQQQMHSKRVTVLEIIGTYFFESTMRYRHVINEFLWSTVNDINLDNIRLPQDGATSHTTAQTIKLLSTQFLGGVI